MNEYYIYLLIIVFLIGIILRILNPPRSKGQLGEDIVKSNLNDLDQEQYKVVNDVLIRRKNGRTSQIDHVVISQYGIFVIETKNYKGIILGSDKGRQWIQKIGKHRNSFYSPVNQNMGHIYALKDLLNNSTKIPFISIVAFTDNAELNLTRTDNKNSHIIYTYDIETTIKKYNEKMLSQTEVLEAYEIIKNNNMSNAQQKKIHVQNVKKHVAKVQAKRKEDYPWL